MPLMDSLVDWTRLRKEALSLRICQQNPQTEKQRGKKTLEQNIQKLWDNYRRCNIHEMGIPEGEERDQGIEEIFEATMFLSQLLTRGLKSQSLFSAAPIKSIFLIDKFCNYFEMFHQSISKAESPSCFIYSKISHVV